MHNSVSKPTSVPAPGKRLKVPAIATQILLIVCAVTSVLSIATEIFGISAATDFLNGAPDALDRLSQYDRLVTLGGWSGTSALLVTGLTWSVWQYRCAARVASRLRRSPRWHAGSWFVPIISLWFPYQNICDLWRSIGRRRPDWLPLWWLGWLTGGVLVRTSTEIATAAENLVRYRLAMMVNLAGEVLLLVAAVMTWSIVRGITRGIEAISPETLVPPTEDLRAAAPA